VQIVDLLLADIIGLPFKYGQPGIALLFLAGGPAPDNIRNASFPGASRATGRPAKNHCRLWTMVCGDEDQITLVKVGQISRSSIFLSDTTKSDSIIILMPVPALGCHVTLWSPGLVGRFLLVAGHVQANSECICLQNS
jgi:hypothetical protein